MTSAVAEEMRKKLFPEGSQFFCFLTCITDFIALITVEEDLAHYGP